MSFIAFASISAIIGMFLVSLFTGRTKGWLLGARRSEQPFRYWTGMAVFGAVAAFIGYLTVVSLR